jgi:hypothetical protein
VLENVVESDHVEPIALDEADLPALVNEVAVALFEVKLRSFVTKYADADEVDGAALDDADVSKNERVDIVPAVIDRWDDHVAFLRDSNLTAICSGRAEIDGAAIRYNASVAKRMPIRAGIENGKILVIVDEGVGAWLAPCGESMCAAS